MKTPQNLSMMPFLRAYLEGGSQEENVQNAGRIAEFIVEKAMSGHFAYFKLVLDLVDGKLHRTAEDEMTCESDCMLVLAVDRRCLEISEAA